MSYAPTATEDPAVAEAGHYMTLLCRGSLVVCPHVQVTGAGSSCQHIGKVRLGLTWFRRKVIRNTIRARLTSLGTVDRKLSVERRENQMWSVEGGCSSLFDWLTGDSYTLGSNPKIMTHCFKHFHIGPNRYLGSIEFHG